jgi:hypothetical protein
MPKSRTKARPKRILFRFFAVERSFRSEVLGISLMLLLISASAVVAQPEDGPAKGGPPKPAWRWTVDERLARRLDPEAMKARAEERAAEIKAFEKRFPAPPQNFFGAEAKNKQNVDTIRGEKHPELFLTIELFDHLLDMGFPFNGTGQQESRGLVEERAVALGFGRDLWSRLGRAVNPFLKMQRREEQFAQNGTLPSRSAGGSTMSPEALRWCQARARAIAAAETEFGKEPFLRLLYSGVTPGFSITYAVSQGTADRLRYLEGGCQ